ncbi:MAG: head-tail adaptor protein [Pseudomonadota bacterium]
MIGALRDRVEILKPTRVADGGGGYSFAYQSLGDVAAQTQGQRAVRDRSYEMTALRRRKRFIIRSRDDLVFEMRLVHCGQHYRITDIQDDDPKGRFTQILCEETMQ